MPRRISNILRRYFKADRFLFSGFIIMRACSFCRIYNFFCVITPESSHCERYFRSYLECKLAFLDVKAEWLFKEKKRLVSEIAAIYAKITRLRKQHRAVIKKLRDLGSREDRNIFEFKIDKIMISNLFEILQEENGQFPILKTLNSFSPRLSSFTVPVEREGFTDLFFKLLNSPGRSARVPQDNSWVFPLILRYFPRVHSLPT
jgi:hypothetical protein